MSDALSSLIGYGPLIGQSAPDLLQRSIASAPPEQIAKFRAEAEERERLESRRMQVRAMVQLAGELIANGEAVKDAFVKAREACEESLKLVEEFGLK